MIICMQCGEQNEGKNLRKCQNCGAILPRMDTSAMVQVEEQSGRVKQFANAVEKVRSEEWGAEDFYEFLNGVYEQLRSLREEIEEIIVQNQYGEYAPEEVEGGLEGMDCFEEGMQEMSIYVEDGDISHLDLGMEKIVEGNRRINEAKRINRSSRKELEEQWGTI
ncbi:MAG: hypothetical protein ACI38Q_00140 [Candidatus Bruticola sp.]